jgi:hypothetical protein
MTSISREKLKSPAENRKPISERLKLDEYNLCVVRQTHKNLYTIKIEVVPLKNVLAAIKEVETKSF